MSHDYSKLKKTKYEKDINYHLFGDIQRPWGYELRVAIFDDNDQHVGSACITWPKEKGVPDQAEIDSKVVARILKYKEKRDNPPAEPVDTMVASKEDIEDYLVKRGYLQEGQTMLDLPDLTPGTDERPTWRRVWDFLNKPLWGAS